MIISHSPAETMDYGQRLAAELRAGDVLALTGDLGAGKTCLVKGIARGLGILQEITSPTFTLINEYVGGRLPLYHVDLYRLDSAEQALQIGLDDYLGRDGVTVIEWAEKVESLLPPTTRRLRVEFIADNSRRITLT